MTVVAGNTTGATILSGIEETSNVRQVFLLTTLCLVGKFSCFKIVTRLTRDSHKLSSILCAGDH
jgi:hypothetical protein